MPRLCLVADVINHYGELIQRELIRSIKANNIGNRFCNGSVVKFNAERGLTFRDDQKVGSPRNFLKQIFNKRKYEASGDRFCNSFTNR